MYKWVAQFRTNLKISSALSQNHDKLISHQHTSLANHCKACMGKKNHKTKLPFCICCGLPESTLLRAFRLSATAVNPPVQWRHLSGGCCCCCCCCFEPQLVTNDHVICHMTTHGFDSCWGGGSRLIRRALFVFGLTWLQTLPAQLNLYVFPSTCMSNSFLPIL